MSLKQLFSSETNRWYGIYTLLYIAIVFVMAGFVWLEARQFPTSISEFDFILLSLATFRIIRLFVYDKVMLFVRDFFASAHSTGLRIAGELLNCPWCFGLWASTFVVFFYYVMPMAWFVFLFLAIAGIGSFIQILMNKIGWNAELFKMEAMSRRGEHETEVGPKA
jgi:energy-converting hydrogenase Eha subunit G